MPATDLYEDLDFDKDMNKGRSVTGWQLLKSLHQNPDRELDVNKIADELGLSSMTVKRRVKTLEKWKLVSYRRNKITKKEAIKTVLEDKVYK
ncbi:MAG: winged helix-turn-helix domain-containing protein [Candidatus Odinarchaeota archaeon]